MFQRPSLSRSIIKMVGVFIVSVSLLANVVVAVEGNEKIPSTSDPAPVSSAAPTATATSQATTPQAGNMTQKTESTAGEGRAMVSDDTLLKALNDKRYLTRQLKCALSEGPCDPVGRKLKTYAPLVLRGSCPKCTPHETRQIQQVLSHVQRHYPKEWNKIIKQFAGSQ